MCACVYVRASDRAIVRAGARACVRAVDPVGTEVANQSNSGMPHSSTLGAWVCRAG